MQSLIRLLNRIPEGLYRIGGFCLFLCCVLHKWSIRDSYTNAFLWVLETGIFVFLALFYLLRRAPKKLPENASESLLTLIGGAWPFLLLLTKRSDFGLEYQDWLLSAMAISTALTLLSYLYLNEAFSIMVEARVLKTSGPYSWVRHPVYSGQLITAAVVLLWRFSFVNGILFLGFCAIQYYRALLEEQKLSSAFEDYEKYAQKRGMFFPKLRGRC